MSQETRNEEKIMLLLPIEDIQPSKTNPRKNFDDEHINALAESIKTHGVLQPILVRPVDAGGYEVVSGECRLRASKAAALEEIPAQVRDFTDEEVQELQLVENLQRRDLHPIEEAEAFRKLINRFQFPISRVADQIGRSVHYVYDRLQLLDLGDVAREIFLSGRITPAHAVILGRLSVEDQGRVIGDPDNNFEGGKLFVREEGLFSPYSDENGRSVKCCSVKELQAWVDTNVRFAVEKAQAMLFSETIEAVNAAREEDVKVVEITHEHYIQPHIREDGSKIISPRSWKRADGKHDSDECDHSVVGVIVSGPGRGEAFRVCVAKDKCAVHWSEYQKEKSARKKERLLDDGTASERAEKEAARRKAEQEKNEREEAERKLHQERWKKCKKHVLQAFATALIEAPTDASSPIAAMLVQEFKQDYTRDCAEISKFVHLDDSERSTLLRLAFFIISAGVNYDWSTPQGVMKAFKKIGVDVKKIMNEHAPLKGSVSKKPVKKTIKKTKKKS